MDIVKKLPLCEDYVFGKATKVSFKTATHKMK